MCFFNDPVFQDGSAMSDQDLQLEALCIITAAQELDDILKELHGGHYIFILSRK